MEQVIIHGYGRKGDEVDENPVMRSCTLVHSLMWAVKRYGFNIVTDKLRNLRKIPAAPIHLFKGFEVIFIKMSMQKDCDGNDP